MLYHTRKGSKKIMPERRRMIMPERRRIMPERRMYMPERKKDPVGSHLFTHYF